MEQKTIGSPLSRICYQDSTFMLEALLPFVPLSLKLPLAVMIKWNEFQRMLSVFQNKELLSRYGLEEQEFTIQGLTNQLAGCPNPKLTESIGQMGQMMQMMQMMQTVQTMQNTEFNTTAEANTASSLDAVISDILRQYDNTDTHANEDTATNSNLPPEEESTSATLPSGDNSTDSTQLSESVTDPLADLNIEQFVKEIFS